MNKRTKFEEPAEDEVDFDIKAEEKPEIDTTPFSVEDLLQWETNTLVNTSGRITFTGPEETLQEGEEICHTQHKIEHHGN